MRERTVSCRALHTLTRSRPPVLGRLRDFMLLYLRCAARLARALPRYRGGRAYLWLPQADSAHVPEECAARVSTAPARAPPRFIAHCAVVPLRLHGVLSLPAPCAGFSRALHRWVAVASLQKPRREPVFPPSRTRPLPAALVCLYVPFRPGKFPGERPPSSPQPLVRDRILPTSLSGSWFRKSC